MTKLHIFDMDGTLLRGSACLHISEHVGVIDQVLRIEEAWARGDVGHVEFYELCLPLWVGLTEDGIDRVFAGSPWLRNVERVFADIAARGEFSAVVTLSPLFFVERLRRLGATTAHGASVLAGDIPDPSRVLTPQSKVRIAEDLCRQHGVSLRDCVAYGDSSSDIPLFGTLRHTVGVNPSPDLAALARKIYTGDDLWDAYAIGRSLIDTPAGEE